MMKKFLSLLAVCTMGTLFAASAATPATTATPAKAAVPVKAVAPAKAVTVAPTAEEIANYPISYFQIGIWNKFPRSQMESNVIGIKSGWPMCSGYGTVTGLEASWLGSLTQHIVGAQLGWTVCYTHDLEGLQATLITCICRDRLDGAQLSPIFNMAGSVTGLQASCINLAEKFKGFQPAAILNITGDVTGFQAALVLNVAKDVAGVQASLLNKAEKSDFQLGLLNFAKKGFQFGLLNFMDDGFVPCFPLVNFSCK